MTAKQPAAATATAPRVQPSSLLQRKLPVSGTALAAGPAPRPLARSSSPLPPGEGPGVRAALPNTSTLQATLSVNTPKDKYEKNLDTIADSEIRRTTISQVLVTQSPSVQRKQASDDNREVFICFRPVKAFPLANHAFFRLGAAAPGNTTISLEPDTNALGPKQGIPATNYESDLNANVDCQKVDISAACVERSLQSYPRGRYSYTGPNSNTYVGSVASDCGLKTIDPPGITPGFHAPRPSDEKKVIRKKAQPSTPRFLPKLTVNTPGDKYEQEADRVADMVMRMPEPKLQAPSPLTPLPGGEGKNLLRTANDPMKKRVQRQCATCAAKGHTSEDCPDCKKKKQGLGGTLQRLSIQRLSTQGDSAAGMAAPPIVSRVLSTPGIPLPADTRSFMESRFGADFSHVRVHTDSLAAESAVAVQAKAYTVGNHIAFASGNSFADHRLLAHELTHTLQQGGERVPDSTVQRMPALIPAMVASRLIGQAWLDLSPETKLSWIDQALDLVLTVVDKIPGQHLLGEMWSFISSGMRGFFQSIRNAAVEVKIATVDKVASIMAMKDLAFAGGMAKGLLKGFFVDGLLGPFVAVYDIVKSLPGLWDFIKHVGDMMDEFPDELGKLIEEAKQFGAEVSEKIGPALNEVKTYFLDPAKAAELVSQMAGHARGMAESLGGKIAGLMMNVFSAPGASAAIGETGGSLIGNAIFEAVAAALTGGGALAIAGAKKGAAYMAKLAAKIGGKLLPVLKDLSILFEEAVSMIKGLVKLVKGKVLEPIAEKFNAILDRVKAFAGRILGGCTENSPLNCNFRAREKSKDRRKRQHEEARRDRPQMETPSKKREPLPERDDTGKLHTHSSDLPRIEVLREYSRSDLQRLRKELVESVKVRNSAHIAQGRKGGHGSRQSREAALIKSIDKLLGE